MKYSIKILIFCLTTLILNSCVENNPNLNKSGEDELKSLEVEIVLNKELFHFNDIIYVPIYSDIYIDKTDPEHLLATTLSIRNTSFNDTLYISKIDYYNTEGGLIRKYIDKTICLNPMGSVNYVVEKEGKTVGSGANFIVELSAKSPDIKPLIQAIMIGGLGHESFLMSMDGYSLKMKEPAGNK